MSPFISMVEASKRRRMKNAHRAMSQTRVETMDLIVEVDLFTAINGDHLQDGTDFVELEIERLGLKQQGWKKQRLERQPYVKTKVPVNVLTGQPPQQVFVFEAKLERTIQRWR